MIVLNAQDSDFERKLDEFEKIRSFENSTIEEQVRDIILTIREKGDEALIDYTVKFDKTALAKNELMVSGTEIKNAYTFVEKKIVDAIKAAIERIKTFHGKQKLNSWIDTEPDGNILGQLIRPLQRICIYAPGGKAAYPSSVYMCAIPAIVAGVKEIVLATPPRPDKTINPYVLVTADLLGISEIYRIGGAQAVASLAYGTESIPKVDKIVGPGNIYVTFAKKLVFGQCDIDMLAGPSEVLVIADEDSDPEFIAADLLSQAEHDEQAISILVTPSLDLLTTVKKKLYLQMEKLKRRDIIEKSIENNCLMILTRDLSQAIDISNGIAPEHLELSIENPFTLLPGIVNAGSIFLGYYTPEAMGDYILGPNHVLPTSGTARFSSPLGVSDFIKRSSVSYCSEESLKLMGEKAINVASIEGLEAHAQSIKKRQK
ncbi:MAG: histidinol dehydrogenase, partial [bacterium]